MPPGLCSVNMYTIRMRVSLLNHSWYSLLEGVSSPEELLDHAARLGYRAFALTDTNNLFGAVPFIDLARQFGIKPILGAVLRSPSCHCLALTADHTGYRNLCKTLSRLLLSKDPELPEIMLECAEGLHVLADRIDLLEKLRPVFGERLWIALERSGLGLGLPVRQRELLEFGERSGILPVALHACYFSHSARFELFEVARAIGRRELLERAGVGAAWRAKHLPPLDYWPRQFADFPSALENAELLADRLEEDVLPRKIILPEPLESHGMESAAFLRLACVEGMSRRGMHDDGAAKQRLQEELHVIGARGLPGYFLTVDEITRLARSRGYSPALRGSAGNSLVCYLLGITDVDPLRHGLPFERFLHLERPDLPDIDLDFDWKVRDALIDEVLEKRGRHLAARISTHLFLQPKSALREAGRIHGLSDEQISRLGPEIETRLAPFVSGADAGELPSPPRSWPLARESWGKMFHHARLAVGLPRHLSIHPGGIVITPTPLEEYVPLQWSKKGVVVTQFEKEAVERIGLVKIDLLGNRALATVDEAWRLSGGAGGMKMARLEEDLAAREMVLRGDTLGVNQLESPGMRHLLAQMRADGIDDVIRALALIRPGAASIGMKERFIRRRRGKYAGHEPEAELKHLLGDTECMLLYEDDSLRVLQALGGMTASEADAFRKRLGKWKTPSEKDLLEKEYHSLCAGSGLSVETLADLWTQLSKFNQYSFCKSHAVSYGLIAWRAVWLKARFPREFWVAALNNNQGVYPKRVYVEAARRAGIPFFRPCVNFSTTGFSPEKNGIRVGLGSIAGLPDSVKESVLREREGSGPFVNLADLVSRAATGPEALALLICSGACDGFGAPRPLLNLQAESELGRAGRELFGFRAPGEWNPVDFSRLGKALEEWRLLGFTTDMPLLQMFRRVEKESVRVDGLPCVPGASLPARIGEEVCVEGLVATARRTTTESGKPMHFISLEDESGLADIVVFAGSCAPVPHLTAGPYIACGTVEDHHGVAVLRAASLSRGLADRRESSVVKRRL
ncbi:MAG: DNA polymerase III subunit alpha [Gemmataceae bacterium]|nr:DNA polymerase III subunit alpha [Gemmataceae bacterium]